VKVIRKIIVPIDFLQHTEQLVEYAVYIGEKFHAGLEFLHTIEPPHCDGDCQFVEKYRNSCFGTHGRKGLEKMWLGSVAERVIEGAPCPTLTCNPYK
jgi:nucleotide-binding universal stress UspA family protein